MTAVRTVSLPSVTSDNEADLSGRNDRPRVVAPSEALSRSFCRGWAFRAIMTRSSAYARQEMVEPWYTHAPDLSLEAFTLTMCKIYSIQRLNKIGLRGQPCLTPARRGIAGVSPWGGRITDVAPV